MYCNKCGKKIDDISNFCVYCGFKTNPIAKISQRTWILKVAGVTFNNSDGSSRQKLISKLKPGEPLYLVPYIFENRDAIYVKNMNNFILGNIPAQYTTKIKNKLSKKVIASVNVEEVDSFRNENNKKIYFFTIKLLINFKEKLI